MDRTGHYGTHAGECKRPVDRKPKEPLAAARRDSARLTFQMRAQRRRAFVARLLRPHGEDRRAFEKGAGGERSDFVPNLRQARGIDAIGLGDRHRPARHAEPTENGEVLARLRHHPIVGGHHQEREIDAARTRGHGVHQALVAGHVDESEHFAVGER